MLYDPKEAFDRVRMTTFGKTRKEEDWESYARNPQSNVWEK